MEEFNGTDLESYAGRVKDIQSLHQSGEISKDECRELLEDLKTEVEVEAQCSSMETKATFIKSIDLLAKFI